jgi:hypothetical protein
MLVGVVIRERTIEYSLVGEGNMVLMRCEAEVICKFQEGPE